MVQELNQCQTDSCRIEQANFLEAKDRIGKILRVEQSDQKRQAERNQLMVEFRKCLGGYCKTAHQLMIREFDRYVSLPKTGNSSDFRDRFVAPYLSKGGGRE